MGFSSCDGAGEDGPFASTQVSCTLVESADGKGVPIRCAADQAAIEDHRPKKGPKPNRKKMATLEAVYTIERHRRTPEEVAEALFRHPGDNPDEKGKRPEPQHKRVRASLARSPDGRTKFYRVSGASVLLQVLREPLHIITLEESDSIGIVKIDAVIG